jgi:hypothetical protein
MERCFSECVSLKYLIETINGKLSNRHILGLTDVHCSRALAAYQLRSSPGFRVICVFDSTYHHMDIERPQTQCRHPSGTTYMFINIDLNIEEQGHCTEQLLPDLGCQDLDNGGSVSQTLLCTSCHRL